MNCMKCGREVESGQVFCRECLAEMEKYPVKPGAVVQLPARKPEDPAKKQNQRRKTALTLEEQVSRLKKMNQKLIAALAGAMVLVVALSAVAGVVLGKLDVQKLLGQNYSTVVNTTPAETTGPAEVE